jgi:copper homeostasis protein (lipoprotein)
VFDTGGKYMITERTVCPWLLAVSMWLAPVTLAQTVTGTASYRERMLRAQAQAEKSGMFRYLADSANFMDCETRQSVPVAMEGAYKTLEAHYLRMRQQPGEELLVTLQGSVMERPGAEGDRRVPTLVVDRYTGMWPGETCGTPGATRPLQETYWKLTRIQGKPVIVAPKQREASLTFLKQGNAVTGFSGCNELSGTYMLNGNKITFRGFADTLLVCLDDMETENALLPALKTVRSWRIFGEHLELLDDKSAMVARFEARELIDGVESLRQGQ